MAQLECVSGAWLRGALLKIFIIPHHDRFNPYWCCPRGEAIVRQGLEAHPDVELVESADGADFVILDFVGHWNGQKWDRSGLSQYDPDKLVVIDFQDEWDKPLAGKFHSYFKRSLCRTRGSSGPHDVIPTKLFVNDQPRTYPITYGVLDEFPRGMKPFEEREVAVGCYLRPSCPNRAAVLNVMRGLASTNPDYHCGAVSDASRSVGTSVFVDPTYFDQLENTRINVTCGPTFWEGDSRLWESMAAGCVTFMDRLYTPLPKSLDGLVVFYDMGDLAELRRKIHMFDTGCLMSDLGAVASLAQKYALENYSSAAIMSRVVATLKGA